MLFISKKGQHATYSMGELPNLRNSSVKKLNIKEHVLFHLNEMFNKRPT